MSFVRLYGAYLLYAAVDAGGPGSSIHSPLTGLVPALGHLRVAQLTRPACEHLYASSHHGVTKDLVVQLPCQSPLIRAFPTGADAHTTQGPVLKFLPLRKRRSLCKTFWWESRCTVPRPDRDACKASSAVGHSNGSVARTLPRAVLHHRWALVTRDVFHAPVVA